MLAPDTTQPALSKEDELHWLALCLIPGLGTRRAGQLIERYHSPQAIFRASRSELESRGLSGSVAQTIASGCTFANAVDQQQKMLETGTRLVPYRRCRLSRAASGNLRPAHCAVRARKDCVATIHPARSRGYQASYRLWNGRCGAFRRGSSASGTRDCERHGARHRYRGAPRRHSASGATRSGVRLRRGSGLSGGEPEACVRNRGERSDHFGVSNGRARISAELSDTQSHHQWCRCRGPGGGGRAIFRFGDYRQNGAGSATGSLCRTRKYHIENELGTRIC